MTQHLSEVIDQKSRRLILDFKDMKPYAMEHYEKLLRQFLATQEYRHVIIPIPEHRAYRINAVTILASRVQDMADVCQCLIRHKTAASSCMVNHRSTHRFLSTVRISSTNGYHRRHVILLDDVVTSGSTMYAAKQLIMDHNHLPLTVTQLSLARYHATQIPNSM